MGSAAPARVHVTTFLFTLGTACFVPAAVGAVVVLPLALNLFGVAAPAERVLAVARWPLLLLAVVLGLALVYRFGPSRRPAERRWVTWGSAFAAALWPEISGARPHWAAVEPPTRAARAGRNAPAFRDRPCRLNRPRPELRREAALRKGISTFVPQAEYQAPRAKRSLTCAWARPALARRMVR
ncbi:MAG: hypothetical protein AVDCRST_MAG04-1103 [uncultured Acetobacteraceae bacterium]|uniref:Uncharacterized protein n=1 Tax=uncultured Acetobacteraceae bacterium TaxID=169975 RepID=A0A6J4HQ33_9PROT|nr:MAG: hypothetical protein AVDCRST_MAG04-1103 [uncultured Acetobacteraceae bacterium]